MKYLLAACLVVMASLFEGVSVAANEHKPTDQFNRISPVEAGYAEEELEVLKQFLEEKGSSALLLLHDGKVFFEWGEIHKKHTIHSIRKAMLNSLFGVYEARGAFSLSETLADAGIDDRAPALTPLEKTATIEDLLKSRSGISHRAAAETAGMHAQKPPRGTHAPGETYQYNNWDFNVLNAILEARIGKSIFEAYYDEIAKPLGMLHFKGIYSSIHLPQDGDTIPVTDGFYQYEKDRSDFPAYHFRMSAHDMALYGQLYLNRGWVEW